LKRKQPRKPYRKPDREKSLEALVDFAGGTWKAGRRAESDSRRLLANALTSGPLVDLSDARHEILGTAAGEIAPWSSAQIEFFRRDLRKLLLGLAAHDEEDGLLPEIALGRMQWAPALEKGSRVVLSVDGAASDVLWVQILLLLRDVGFERIRKCPGCQRLLVKFGKRDYCTPKCQNRNNQRRWQQDRAERERRKASRSRS
jgi:hypothetical protein